MESAWRVMSLTPHPSSNCMADDACEGPPVDPEAPLLPPRTETVSTATTSRRRSCSCSPLRKQLPVWLLLLLLLAALCVGGLLSWVLLCRCHANPVYSVGGVVHRPVVVTTWGSMVNCSEVAWDTLTQTASSTASMDAVEQGIRLCEEDLKVRGVGRQRPVYLLHGESTAAHSGWHHLQPWNMMEHVTGHA